MKTTNVTASNGETVEVNLTVSRDGTRFACAAVALIAGTEVALGTAQSAVYPKARLVSDLDHALAEIAALTPRRIARIYEVRPARRAAVRTAKIAGTTAIREYVTLAATATEAEVIAAGCQRLAAIGQTFLPETGIARIWNLRKNGGLARWELKGRILSA